MSYSKQQTLVLQQTPQCLKPVTMLRSEEETCGQAISNNRLKGNNNPSVFETVTMLRSEEETCGQAISNNRLKGNNNPSVFETVTMLRSEEETCGQAISNNRLKGNNNPSVFGTSNHALLRGRNAVDELYQTPNSSVTANS